LKIELTQNNIGQQEVDRKKGLEFDQTIRLTGYYTNKEYPEQLRLVGYKDPKTDKELVFFSITLSCLHSPLHRFISLAGR